MTSFDDAVSAVKHHSAAFQSALRSWPAYLGDGDGNVIGSQVNYYHCRYPTPESPAIEVYANGCPPNDGQKVMIGYTADQPDLIKIVSWNDSVLDDTVNDHVKNHGEQHAYLGGDTVWVDWRQIMTFRVQPYSGLTVYVNGGVLPRAGADLQIIPQIIDLTSSVPGSSGQSRYALLSIDTTGAIVVTDGTVVSPIMALDASDVPSTPAGNFRLAAVALQYGQTLITESLLQRDILDLRWPQESMAGSGVITPAMLANASAQYKYLVSGATPFAYAESAGALNIASGKTLTVSNSITLTGTDGGTTSLAVTSGKTLTLTAADNYGLTITGNSTINGSLVGNITGSGTIATGGFTVTIPATGTVALATGISGGQTIYGGTAANDDLTIDGTSHATKTTSVIFAQPSGGKFAIGSATISSIYRKFYLDDSAVASTSGTEYGVGFIGSATGSAPTTGAYYLLRFGLNTYGNGLNTICGILGFAKTSSTNLTSVAVGNQAWVEIAGSGNISNSSAFAASLQATGTATGGVTGTHRNFDAKSPSMVAGTGTIANSIGFYAENQGAANVTNAYGLYIAAQSGAATINSAITTLGGTLSFTHNADSILATFTGHTTLAATNPIIKAIRNDAAAGVSQLMQLTSLGSGADGDGGSILLSGKSSTTAAQSMGALKWLWTSATHASRKAKIQVTTYDTAERIGLAIEADGAAQDVYFEGGAGSGLPYGGCWGNEIGWSQASAAQDTWYIISDADMADSSGGLNLVTHDGSGKLTVTKAGRYYVVYTVSQTNDRNNKHIQTGIAINGTVQNDGINHVDGLAANIDTVLSGNAILALTASQYIEIAIRTTDTGTPTISVDHLNITIFQVGG